MLRRFLCRHESTHASTFSLSATLPIGAYINDLYACDKTLVKLIQKTEMEILRVTKLGSTKHVAKRRIMLKRHKANIEDRRDSILARILQLEALHINNMQIDALKGVTKAFKGSKYTIGDVDELLDKLEDFKEDFDTINERLSEDIAFSNQDIDEDELMMELQQLEEKDTPSIQKMLTNQSPALPDAPKQVTLENEQGDHDACSTGKHEKLLPTLS